LGSATTLPKAQARAAYNRTLQPFYFNLCWKCQRHTRFDQWLGVASNDSRDHMAVGGGGTADGASDIPSRMYHTPWHEPWEPFYIARTDTVPEFDERFKQYGFNRISQVCAMHMARLSFCFVFVVWDRFKQHPPHIRTIGKSSGRSLFYFIFVVCRWAQCCKQSCSGRFVPD
jgi:hypothetical protein